MVSTSAKSRFRRRFEAVFEEEADAGAQLDETAVEPAIVT